MSILNDFSAILRGILPLKDEKLKELRLNPTSTFSIGRFKEASCVIFDVNVSRQPALFRFDEKSEIWTLTDKKSMNGVFVNGLHIKAEEPYPLKDGDVIKLGSNDDYRWTFQLVKNKEESCSPSTKRLKKSISDAEMIKLQEPIVREMKKTIERVDNEKKMLEIKVNESKEALQKLIYEKNELLTKFETQMEELRVKHDSERREIEEKLKKMKANQRKIEIIELETRFRNEKQKIENKFKEKESEIEKFETEKRKILNEQQNIIAKLSSEKEKAENLVQTVKKKFEKDFLALKFFESDYKKEIEKLSNEMENRLKEGKIQMEIEIERLRNENEKMRMESSEAFERLRGFIGSCDAELRCSICDEMFINPMSTNCGHVYCKYCLARWKSRCASNKDYYSCPNCRVSITSETRNHIIDNLIHRLVKDFGEDRKIQREKLIQERQNDELKFEKFLKEMEEQKSSSKFVHPLMRQGAIRRRRRRNPRRNDSEDEVENRDESSPTPTTSNDQNPDQEQEMTNNEPVIVISSDSDSDNSDSSLDSSDASSIEGDPDATYGGYEECYICHRRGHWAPGCPFR